MTEATEFEVMFIEPPPWGLEFEDDSNGAAVVKAFPLVEGPDGRQITGPAQRACVIGKNDTLVGINGQDITGLSYWEVVTKLSEKAGFASPEQPVTLRFRTPPHEFNVTFREGSVGLLLGA